MSATRTHLVPTLCVEMPAATLRVTRPDGTESLSAGAAERRGGAFPRRAWERGGTTLALLIAALLPGVLRAEDKPNKTETRSLTVNDAKRTYRLHLPPGGAVKPLPLVVSIHGAAADGLIQEVMTGLSPLADKEGFAVVYPDGLSRIWRVNSDAELDFFKALFDELVREKVAEPRRIYVCGMSNGGFMTAKLGVELGDRIAAIAPVAGTAFGKNGDKVKRPVPVLYIHGDKDTFVNIEGRRVYQSADDFVAWWAGQNVCDKPLSKQLPDDKDDGCAVEVITHGGKAPVIYYKIKGGGHTWPGGSPLQPERLLGKTCTEFNASEAIWQFFKQHELPEKK